MTILAQATQSVLCNYMKTLYISKLGLGFEEKILSWLLPRFPHLVMEHADLNILHPNNVETARNNIPKNLAEDRAYWKPQGGEPTFPALPDKSERGYKLSPSYTASSGQVSSVGEKYRPWPTLGDSVPKGFFCIKPFQNLIIDVEHTFTCCHSKWPLNRIPYGLTNGIFRRLESPDDAVRTTKLLQR